MNAGSSPIGNRQRGAAIGWKRPSGMVGMKCTRERGGLVRPPSGHVTALSDKREWNRGYLPPLMSLGHEGFFYLDKEELFL